MLLFNIKKCSVSVGEGGFQFLPFLLFALNVTVEKYCERERQLLWVDEGMPGAGILLVYNLHILLSSYLQC